MLHRAALLALRGFGAVESNPMVGCVIGREDGTVLGLGHYRRYGGPHAEVDALRNCRERGHDPRGATVWVTLEPCCCHQKTPPCTEALIKAGVARVVAARRDPHPAAVGGLEQLEAAGIEVTVESGCALATGAAASFVHRVETRLPWVIGKWAQTIDGRTATRSGESQWITGPVARRHVHQLRGRVDAILTGMGTVDADDPTLTCRGVHARRTARRVVIDPMLEICPKSRLLSTLDQAPLTILTSFDAPAHARRSLEDLGVDVVPLPEDDETGLDIKEGLLHLAVMNDVSVVMTEAGSGVLGELLDLGLMHEAWVYVGSVLMGDVAARGALAGEERVRLSDASRMTLMHTKRLGQDVLLRYRVGDTDR